MLVLATLHCRTLPAKDNEKSDAPANAATRKISDEARRILGSIQTTKYKHRTDINEAKGQYYCDCSGFVGYVLNRTVGKHDRQGPLHNGDRRPVAMEYAKLFAAAPTKANGRNRWQHIVRLADTRPGDIIAWRHDKPMPGNTGHVVIVDEQPVIEQDGLVRVVVIDSTTLPWQDSSGAKHGSGVGRRTMWFTVDDMGRPVGYVRGSRSARPKDEQIAIGRALLVGSTKTTSALGRRTG